MYNYHSAFLEQARGLTEDQIKEISVAAVIQYKQEFPNVGYIGVNFYFETKHVEASGGPEPRLYSWKQLGFQF